MWLPRHVEALALSPKPMVLLGGEEFGVPYLIDALRQRTRVAWFELGPRTWHDPVAQGNALARAVNTTLPSPLLGMALPLRTQLSALNLYKAELLPLTLALTAEAPTEGLLLELLELANNGYSLVIDLRGSTELPAELAGLVTALGPSDLRLSLAEATELLPRAFSGQKVERVWRESGGGFQALLAAVTEAFGLGAPAVPGATGEQVPDQEAQYVEPSLAVQALRRHGDLVGALELAVMSAPELVHDLIRRAGPRYQEEGLLERLHLLLSALPEEFARSERVLEWRMVAGFAAGDLGHVLPDVDAHLAVHTAPALRARRAGTMRREQGFELAQQAVGAQRTPLTLWQYGRLHPNAATALDALREAVQLAEDSGQQYDVVRNAGALVARLSKEGEFRQAASWARWTLDLFDRGDVSEGIRRLRVVNDLGVARIMTGDLVGLRRVLEDAQTVAEGGLPSIAALLRSTLAWFELAEQRPRPALELLNATYQASNLATRARQGYQLVRCLLELNRVSEAAEVAADIGRLAPRGASYEQALAALARGMVGAVAGDEAERRAASEDLESAMLTADLVAEQRLMAALYFLLVTDGGAARLPPELARLLGQLHPTGLRVLSGPERLFAPVWAALSGASPTLSLRFLAGEVRAVQGGVEQKLPQRVAEVALAIALHPSGIGRDELNAFLTPEGQPAFTAGGVRGMLTRVRSLLPVSDVPYRFTVSFGADVLQLREYLASQRVREAVSLYRQPLLPLSDAPGVVDERESLEEELRQAVLLSRDPDALCELAERLGDDLEVWASAAEALGPNDPRLAVARARVSRLEQSYAQAS